MPPVHSHIATLFECDAPKVLLKKLLGFEFGQQLVGQIQIPYYKTNRPGLHILDLYKKALFGSGKQLLSPGLTV